MFFLLRIVCLLALPTLVESLAPFEPAQLSQPVSGAVSFPEGKLCDVTHPPYSAKGDNQTVDTAALQRAVDACGDLPTGGTVLLPKGGWFVSGALWLRSNLTFAVEGVLMGSTDPKAYPTTYTRAAAVMQHAHSSLLNGGRCLEMKDPLVGWDDCKSWSKLENVIITGGGEVNHNGDSWCYTNGTKKCKENFHLYPKTFGMTYVNGLTVSGLRIRHPVTWTIYTCFSNNVRITGNDVWSDGHNVNAIVPESTWNVYIANNTIRTRDDCLSLKAGMDWSGRMVNISTENVLIAGNGFFNGHAISIGSETSGWIRDIAVRNNTLHSVEAVVRMKSQRGRGGGAERLLFQGIRGDVLTAIQINMEYKKAKPTNASATPLFRDITVRDVIVTSADAAIVCDGLPEAPVTGLVVENVTVTGKVGQTCLNCFGSQKATDPQLCMRSNGTAVAK
jgi:polygalacturonase